jgi:hypothetical protein
MVLEFVEGETSDPLLLLPLSQGLSAAERGGFFIPFGKLRDLIVEIDFFH